MAFDLKQINYKTVADPKAFVEEGEQNYRDKVEKAAKLIAANCSRSPIVLLSGPSGSGKTTTSMKIAEALKKNGVGSYYVGMDDYYRTQEMGDYPRTPEGEIDFESPDCLDLSLLNEHFDALSRGEAIVVPKYDFTSRSRKPEAAREIRPGADEVVIVEGIHGLNSRLSDRHPEAFKLYISARSDVLLNDVVVFKRTWFRLVRRMVRDYHFRGASAEDTMAMWANVRRGEKTYISPFKNRADYQFDTSLPFELPVFNSVATKLFQTVPEGIERYEELRQVLPAIQLFGHIEPELIPADSLIREFIGGGSYEY